MTTKVIILPNKEKFSNNESGAASIFAKESLKPKDYKSYIIYGNSSNVEKKYKRKDCPVCKGKGFYISGDGISKVDCGYCEAEKTSVPKLQEVKPIPSVLKSSTTTIQPNCPNGNCPSPKQYIIRR